MSGYIESTQLLLFGSSDHLITKLCCLSSLAGTKDRSHIHIGKPSVRLLILWVQYRILFGQTGPFWVQRGLATDSLNRPCCDFTPATCLRAWAVIGRVYGTDSATLQLCTFTFGVGVGRAELDPMVG